MSRCCIVLDQTLVLDQTVQNLTIMGVIEDDLGDSTLLRCSLTDGSLMA